MNETHVLLNDYVRNQLSCSSCHGNAGLDSTSSFKTVPAVARFFYFLFIHFSALEYKNPSKAYSKTTTAVVQIRSCITPSAYKTGPSPNKVTSKRRMIKKHGLETS